MLTGKNAHSWKHYPRNMLFSRAISNGAKWYCPDLFGGPVYTPDEMDAIVDVQGEMVVGEPDATPEEKAAKQRDRAAELRAMAEASEPKTESPLVDSDLPEIADPTEMVSAPAADSSSSPSAEPAPKKRGRKPRGSTNPEDRDAGGVSAKLAEVNARLDAADAEGKRLMADNQKSLLPPPEVSEPPQDPTKATRSQVLEIENLVAELIAADKIAPATIQGAMAKIGASSYAELSREHALQLIEKLKAKRGN